MIKGRKLLRRAKIEFFHKIQEKCFENCVWNYDNGTNNFCNNHFICINRDLYLSDQEWELDDNLNPVKRVLEASEK